MSTIDVRCAHMQDKERSGLEGAGRPEQDEHQWDVGAISHALDQAPDMAHDVAHGPGLRYELAHGAISVELFPPTLERTTGIVRVCTADARHEWFRQPKPATQTDGLIFQSTSGVLTVTASGALAYQHIPPGRHERPPDAPDRQDDTDLPPEASEDAPGDLVPFQPDVRRGHDRTEHQSRVQFAGRLGTDPRTKVTPKGKFVMEFPVAVAVADQEKPEWRHTVVFDAKARALDGVLRKGTAVEVIAYEHLKTKTDTDTARRREVREYYATAVTPKPRAGEPASEAPRNLQS